LAIGALSPRSAQAFDLGYSVGGGVVIPTADALDRIADIGVHIDLALQYKFYDVFSVGIALAGDFPLSDELPSGTRPTARFIRVGARAMAHHGIAWFRYWVSLDIGLGFNTVSSCNERDFCTEETVSQAAADVSAGIAFVVWDKLSMGPAAGFTLPNLAQSDELYFVHASLRMHWNL